MSGLLELLRRNEAETLIRNAEIVCSYPDCQERADAARRHVHRAMYRAALGQITETERNRILALLAPCCPDLFGVHTPVPPQPDADCLG